MEGFPIFLFSAPNLVKTLELLVNIRIPGVFLFCKISSCLFFIFFHFIPYHLTCITARQRCRYIPILDSRYYFAYGIMGTVSNSKETYL